MCDQERVPTYAMVCVHGIGRQERGQTAREVAHAFALGAAELAGKCTFSATTDDVDTVRAHVVLPHHPPFDVVFHDAWWDARVEPAASRRTLGWMLRVAPFVLAATVALWVYDIGEAFPDRRRLGEARRTLLACVAIALCLVAAPLALALAVLLLPFVLVRRRARRRIGEIIGVWFGDAWSYRSDLLDGSAIAYVLEVMRGARENADATVLVGHSQGAELCRRVALLEPPEGCVWVGSGEAQLGMLRTLRHSPLLPLVLWAHALVASATFGILVASGWRLLSTASIALWETGQRLVEAARTGSPVAVSDAVVAAEAASDALFRAAFEFLPGGLALVAVLSVTLVLVSLTRRWPEDIPRQPECEVMVVKSLLDPVCLGPVKPGSPVRYVPAAPLRRWHLEHIRYFEKAHTGVALIEALIGTEQLRLAPHTPRVPPRLYLVGALAAVACCAGMGAVGTALLRAAGLG
ncbi:hypothetical protein [Microbacterium sp. 18062]|uniref:hypothetical protein n=1 Tax=Microbacterium sp. 18062 TaxID=2681410 RepID=UPI00135CE36D|nr:hypothetical protein [Microbacterium sp. 18062]